jgi:hypothetical protein
VPPIGAVMPEMATLGEAPGNGRCALVMKLLARLRCPSFVGSPGLLFA